MFPHPARSGQLFATIRARFSLTPEDIVLLDRYFPSSGDVALLIKPFTTKVNVASFFFRENGAFQSTAPLEFPLRRSELTGEEAAPYRPMMDRLPRNSEVRLVPAEEEIIDTVPVEPVYAVPPKSRVRSGWVWIPMSFVFLLLGLVLGFQAALTMGPRSGGGPSDFSLGLTVTREGTNLSVKWDREAPAVKAAQKGLLEIEDWRPTKPLDLDVAQLRNGSILSRTIADREIPHDSLSGPASRDAADGVESSGGKVASEGRFFVADSGTFRFFAIRESHSHLFQALFQRPGRRAPHDLSRPYDLRGQHH